MPSPRIPLPPVPVLLLSMPALLWGCAEGDDHLRVRGSAQVALADGTVTGFDFPNDVRLDDDRVAALDGRIAGHCTLGLGGEGEPDVLSVAVVRTAPPGADDQGLRALEVRLEGERAGEVRATLGDRVHTAEAGPTCTLSRPYFRPEEGLAAVEADCALAAPSGETVQARVELHFAGCGP